MAGSWSDTVRGAEIDRERDVVWGLEPWLAAGSGEGQ